MTSTLQPDTPRTRSRAVWASGDYADVARRLLPDLGGVLVGAAALRPGARVLDVAAGAGNVAIAAVAGAAADVVALDVTPELLEVGGRAAEERGVALEWVEGDATDLPFADASFDAVLSCVGTMFAPDHRRTADELLRVCRPGGTIGLLSWTPGGFIGELFRTMAPFAPTPPPGAQSPVLWGSEPHVADLLGDRVTDLRMRTGAVAVGSFDRPLDFRDYMKQHYGPTIATYRHAAANGRADELDAAFAALCERGFTPTADGGWRVEIEYLVALGTRA